MSFGLDPMNMPSPHWKQWPRFHGVHVLGGKMPDLFTFKSIPRLVSNDPGFGMTSPLQNTILTGSSGELAKLIKDAKDLKHDVNFLGQSPLHIATFKEGAVQLLLDAGHDPNVRDHYGATPLMYAAAMGKLDLVKLLINSHGAELLELDFLDCAAYYGHWHVLLGALNYIQSLHQTFQGSEELASNLAKHAITSLVSTGHHPESTWVFTELLCMITDVNFELPKTRPSLKGGTLLHHTDNMDETQALISRGFTLFNAEDDGGATPMMNTSMIHNPIFIKLLLERGANPNHQDINGACTLSRLFKRLTDCLHFCEIGYINGLIESFEILLRHGANILACDRCACPCSPGGCLPTQFLLSRRWPWHKSIGPTLEVLIVLEDYRMAWEAKQILISFIRRSKFEQLGLEHVCCEHKVPWYYKVQKQHKNVNKKDLDVLDEYMSGLMQLSYEDLKPIWLRQMRLAHDAECQLGHENNEQSTKPFVEFQVDYYHDEFVENSRLKSPEGAPKLSITSDLLSLEKCFLLMNKSSTNGLSPLEWYHRRVTWILQFMIAMNVAVEDVIEQIEPVSIDKGICLLATEVDDCIKRLRSFAAEQEVFPGNNNKTR
ncbi:ankyrin repeat-containing domain protein [Biscogniauxia marginata]|nr:ankyrin repeat-containing domain protein [Biscogniauxia marginata]